jgi:hypothetical protein
MPIPVAVRAVGTIAGATALVGVGAVLGVKGGRPLVKQAVLAGLALSERMRDLAEEAREELEDVYAEARAEAGELSRGEERSAPDEKDPIPLRPQRARSPRAISRR